MPDLNLNKSLFLLCSRLDMKLSTREHLRLMSMTTILILLFLLQKKSQKIHPREELFWAVQDRERRLRQTVLRACVRRCFTGGHLILWNFHASTMTRTFFLWVRGL